MNSKAIVKLKEHGLPLLHKRFGRYTSLKTRPLILVRIVLGKKHFINWNKEWKA
jgi:hypothetical protein